jgi:hypothetical protein
MLRTLRSLALPLALASLLLALAAAPAAAGPAPARSASPGAAWQSFWGLLAAWLAPAGGSSALTAKDGPCVDPDGTPAGCPHAMVPGVGGRQARSLDRPRAAAPLPPGPGLAAKEGPCPDPNGAPTSCQHNAVPAPNPQRTPLRRPRGRYPPLLLTAPRPGRRRVPLC